MERDFKWLTAVLTTDCKICLEKIHQGQHFYYEANEKKPYCRDCGRAIRASGYDAAMRERNGIMKLFRGMIDGGF